MEQLMRSVQAGRIVHALLFVGPHGSGKRTVARLFAQAMVCQGESKPCGACPACKRFLAGSHPDIHVVKPEKKSIGVDEVRELIDALALRPYEGGRHIVRAHVRKDEDALQRRACGHADHAAPRWDREGGVAAVPRGGGCEIRIARNHLSQCVPGFLFRRS